MKLLIKAFIIYLFFCSSVIHLINIYCVYQAAFQTLKRNGNRKKKSQPSKYLISQWKEKTDKMSNNSIYNMFDSINTKEQGKIKHKEERLILTGQSRSGLVWSIFQKLQEEIESRSHLGTIYAGGSNSKYRGPGRGTCPVCSGQHCRIGSKQVGNDRRLEQKSDGNQTISSLQAFSFQCKIYRKSSVLRTGVS